MNESFKKVIDEYKTVPPAKTLLINALKEIKPDKKNLGVWVYSGILALVFSIGIGFHEETVEVFRNVIEIFLTIQIAVFGVLFTVYSILLSFLNNDFMKLLANSPESYGKSQLRVCTEYFESVLFLYFMSILLSLSMLIAMKCIHDDYRLTENFVFDCVLASILICVFLVFSLRVLCEIKSTIYNTIILFRTNVACRFVYFSDEDENAEKEEELRQKELILIDYALKKIVNDQNGNNTGD